MKSFQQFINEAPYLYDTRMNMEKVSSLSKKSLEENFLYLGHLDVQNFDIYENKENGGFLGGILIEDEFYPLIRVSCNERSLYVKPMQLSDKRKHIAMVRVSPSFSHQEVAIDTYTFIANHYDLISDRIQYLGAKVLWKSLARQGQVNVYVFDESKKDYLRENDKPIKYNGKNITDEMIWGKEKQHQDRLLVATKKELK